MRIYGIDFTSTPRRGKPITCLECTLTGAHLVAGELSTWVDFASFEVALRRPGPWIAGIDAPFGQARRFIETMGWPLSWAESVHHAESLGRAGFRAALDGYRGRRPAGDKEHRRKTDIATGAISPQKLYGTPVALMFFECAPRLCAAGVTVPGLQAGDPQRIVVEAYPGVLARGLIGRRVYKQHSRDKQSPAQALARRDLFDTLLGGAAQSRYGVRVSASEALIDDPSGDQLDALLCAIQAAWAWTRRDQGFGAPVDLDPLEGWICDPVARTPRVSQ
ncbi:MAG: DUF429 domain-containing protein [Sphingobacteriia bacterium]|nr:DUF429 domain-containing protein [Sphingobacteriia bacterium]NCC41175.1 DUF429 domain-containing protein [Gammaproteobacteria bacterium]